MDEANISNETPNNEDDFDEFESMLNNNVVKSPTKRKQKQETPNDVEEKKSKGKNAKSRRSTSSKERSLSPPMPLLENISNILADKPKVGKTRRSTRNANKSLDQSVDDDAEANTTKDTTQKPTSSKRGRGGRGRGRGRGNGRTRSTSQINSFVADDSSEHSIDSDYTPETTAIISNTDRPTRRGRSRAVRTRRNYVAETAARSQVVDTIDLVNSPFPRVEGSITLDSEGEEVAAPTTQKKNDIIDLDISLDDDNPELSVKITWKGIPEAFKLRKYQKFLTLFKLLAERENTDLEKIVLNLNDRLISTDDTPDSIGYKIYHFIGEYSLYIDINKNKTRKVQDERKFMGCLYEIT